MSDLHDRLQADRRKRIRERLSKVLEGHMILHRKRLEEIELPESIIMVSAWRHALLDAIAAVVEEETRHE